jgi:GNAT superfamily N-acetyltransferase
VRIVAEHGLDRAEVIELYDSVGWTAYTRDPEALLRGIDGSHLVLTARTDDDVLVGLGRTISDGETICYVQDLLVRPDWQGNGVGRALMTHLLRHYAGCRQFVLMTDVDGPAEFYRALGLVRFDERGLVGYVRAANARTTAAMS